MKHLSEKVYMELTPPCEEDPRSDHHRLKDALADKGFENVTLPLHILRSLHQACKASEYNITVSLVFAKDHWIISSIEQGDTRSSHYGLAVDFGSTTIIMQLIDMNSESIIAQCSEKNAQRRYGSDILTRITYTLEGENHAEDLRQASLESFEQLLDEITAESGVDARSCPAMIVSGNTTMIHFMLGLDAWTVFASPYAPVTNDPGWFTGRELDLNFSGMVYIIPAASNYIGGDIVSGLLTLDFYKKDDVSVFFDIGTNGELVMGNREWLLAGAGAAGPALEGYISRYGVRAQAGAIDTVSISGSSIRYITIGNAKPIGICGSGIIDLIAQMRLNNWINIAGELNPNASERIIYLEDEKQFAAVYASANEAADGKPLYFTQTDINQYLETKAAAHTMVDCLLETAGCSEADIDKLYLSGAFCAHSDLESAITVGIFPDLPRDKYVIITNSSLDGARTLLLNKHRFVDIDYLLENLYCVQFASVPDFLLRMHASKFIPHTDMERYPSVEKKLEASSISEPRLPD